MKRAFLLALLLSLSYSFAEGQEGSSKVDSSAMAAWCTQKGGAVIEKNGAPACDLPWLEKDNNGKITLGKVPENYIIQTGHLYYENGLVCKGCKLIVAKDMTLAIVIDKEGYQWPTVGLKAIDEHPYMRRYAQAAAVSAQQYGQQMQQNAQRQMEMFQQNRPLNTNCTTTPSGYGWSNTNCNTH